MHGRTRITLFAVVAALLFAAPAAANPMGQIAATTYADWSAGSFTGSVSFDASSCPEGGSCTPWRADLTTQPNDRPGGCATTWLPTDPVLAIWDSGEQTSYGTV